MTAPAATALRSAEFAEVVRAAAAGRYKPVYLLAGEPVETMAAARTLLDALVPAARRAFNLETYDGRTTPIATIIDSLRMPGFFAGVKVLWVRESALFVSGEKRPEMTKALFAAWDVGREQEAAERLLTLVGLAGWSQEQFADTQWGALSKTRLREVFGDDVDAERVAQLDAVHAVCKARDLAVSAYRDEGGALLEYLDAGPPPQTVLLFTAATVDARKRLVKRLREIGAVVTLSAARERSGALSRESIDEAVRHVARTFGKQLDANALEVIMQRAGTAMAPLTAELEKLCLYVGDRATITEADVRLVFRDMAESWIFDFTGALAARQLARALPQLRSLLDQGEPPLRLLAMIVREVRMLLLARECLDDSLRGTWRQGVTFNVFQARVLPHLDAQTRQAFGNVHPFVLYRRLQDAARITSGTLREALVKLSDIDLRLKSSRNDPALLLEAFVMDWCRAPSPSRQGTDRVGAREREPRAQR